MSTTSIRCGGCNSSLKYVMYGRRNWIQKSHTIYCTERIAMIQQQQYQYQCQYRRQKHTVVYAIGEGWTGALGTGRIDEWILGHNDEEDYYDHQHHRDTTTNTNDNNNKTSIFTSFSTNQGSIPVVLYDTKTSSNASDQSQCKTKQQLISCAVGWAHTALIVQETTTSKLTEENIAHNSTMLTTQQGTTPMPETTTKTTTTTKVLVTGRPHEFASLMRLQRLPRTMRNWMTYSTYNTIRRAHIIDRQKKNSSDTTTNTADRSAVSLNPIDMIGQTLTFLSKIFGNTETDPDWDVARDQSYMIVPTSIPLPFDTTSVEANQTSDNKPMQRSATEILPNTIGPRDPVPNDRAVKITCSAGITAITTNLGYVYTFGLNSIGQCGTGDPSNNVWVPSRVTGLSRLFSSGGGYRATALSQSYPIQQTCLGLQHGLCLNTAGEMFSWGKGDRGQLGTDIIENESHTAKPILKAVIMNDDYSKKIEYHALQSISQISTGMIHSAAYEDATNSVYVWGKHVLPRNTDETIATGLLEQKRGLKQFISREKIASDAYIPIRVNGLPIDIKVRLIACGSHHTSILLEDGSVWCMGMTIDTKRPVHRPICIIDSGVIDMQKLTQFTSHMDRTTIVYDGQVIQVHLWDDPLYQKEAIFTPAWVDVLQLHYPTARIREVHRSWLHTAIVTDHDD